MREIDTKSRLAMILSRLKVFEKPKVRNEQYPTDSEIAADILWKALMNNDIKGKVIVDLGAGTGILALGAAILGAKRAYMIEKDQEALAIAQKNISLIKSESQKGMKLMMINKDIKDIKKGEIKSDTVIMNPPFGSKVRHSDKEFLEKAFEISDIIYSIHKSETIDFIERFCGKKSFVITHRFDYDFPLKSSYGFHTKKIQRIKASCIRLEKKENI